MYKDIMSKNIIYKDIINNINTLCGPAHIYLIFGLFFFTTALIKNIINQKLYLLDTAKRFFIIIIVTYFLDWLYKMGYINFSWFLLYFMFIMILILLIGSFFIINKLIDDGGLLEKIKMIYKFDN